MEMSYFSINPSYQTIERFPVPTELQPLHYGEITNHVPLQIPKTEPGEPSDFPEINPAAPISTQTFTLNDYYTYMAQVKAAAMIKCEVDEIDKTVIQPWVSNQMEENAHCFVSPIKCKSEPNDIKTIYKCCNIDFNDKFTHFSHMINHMEELFARSKCHYCNSTFDNEVDMIRHARYVHIGYNCKYCSQHFYKKHALIQHMTITHGYFPRNNKNVWYSKRSRRNRNCTRKKFTNAKRKWISPALKNKLKCNVKMEPNYETERRNVKIEPSDVIVKMEPADAIVKMEPSYVIVKKEPTDVIV